MLEITLEELRRRVAAKSIYELRQVGRVMGVPHPADGSKERLVECICKIAAGEDEPVAPSTRGAPPKSSEYDRQLVLDLMRYRETQLSKSNFNELQPIGNIMYMAGGDALEFTTQGILEHKDGQWFIRTNKVYGGVYSEVYVNERFINNLSLREGDLISGRCKRNSNSEIAGLALVNSVNGLPVAAIYSRHNFDLLTPIYANRRLAVGCGKTDKTGRLIDIAAPLGAGQRAVIVAPGGCDRTRVLKNLVYGVQQNNSDLKIIIVLIDVSPEVAADFRRAFPDADLFSSSMEAGTTAHLRSMKLALEYSKRLVELGQDVVLAVDDLTKLTNVYNMCIKTITSALDYNAIDSTKKLLAAAKCAEEGGSLTIISSLSTGDGDLVDTAIYSALKDICNLKITLTRGVEGIRSLPRVNVSQSFSSVDEILLSERELIACEKMREKDTDEIYAMLDKTEDNAGLVDLLLG